MLQIRQEWFKRIEVKRDIAKALRDLVLREYSISPQDIDVAPTNIALIQNGRRTAISDAIAIFDTTYGSLRLTEPVFTDIQRLLERFSHAADLVRDQPEAAPISPELLILIG